MWFERFSASNGVTAWRAVFKIGGIMRESDERAHELSIPSGLGRCFGSLPFAKTSMMIIRPPQQGHGCSKAARLVLTGLGFLVGLPAAPQPRAGLSHLGDVGGAVAVGEEAVMADAVEAFGRHMHQEAADELMRGQRHGLVAARPLDRGNP